MDGSTDEITTGLNSGYSGRVAAASGSLSGAPSVTSFPLRIRVER